MKYLITEDQDTRIRALRRLGAVDKLIEYRLKAPFTFDICNRFNKEQLLNHIIEWANEDMYFEYFSDIDRFIDIYYVPGSSSYEDKPFSSRSS